MKAIWLTLGAVLAAALPLQAELTAEQRSVPREQKSPDPALKTIVLLAGSPSNKPGQHEYFAGCALMMDWLKQTPGVWPVLAAEGWPADESILDNAKAVVIYMDGGAKFAPLPAERWARLKKLVESGAGLTVLHQAVDLPSEQAAEFQGWLGAVFQGDIGCRGHWDMSFDTIPTHVVTRGVTGFAAPKDGWLYNLHFQPTGVTPLLTGLVPDNSRKTEDAKAHTGRAEVIAWVYERPSGGRSFGFTGCDLHSSWGIESQRKLVTNAILWTAGIELPTDGAPVAMDAGKLAGNLDRKIFAPKK